MGMSRAVVFSASDQPLSLLSLETPLPGPGEVLVRVVACTLCGSDLHSVEGRRAVPVPTILGHEILGRIEAFGPRTERRDATGTPLQQGDRVTWAVVASCGECFYCARGLLQKCERQIKYGHEAIRSGLLFTGGLADHVVLQPGTSIFRVPDELCDGVACPANCATATIAGAFRLAGEVKGSDVLIAGAGMLGITAAAWARLHRAQSVIVCDRDRQRLSVASEIGATRVCEPSDLEATVKKVTDGRGVDMAIDLTGAADSVEACLSSVRMGGSCVLVGSVFPSRCISIFPEQIVRRCLSIRGLHNYLPEDLEAALVFLTQVDQARFAALVSDWKPLDWLIGQTGIPAPRSGLRLGIRP